VNCSSFESLLDEYVDGALAPRDRALVAAHVPGCANCSSLLEELRVIDALLLGPRTLEPAPNFTFKVMADVRTTPRPHRHRIHGLALIGTYLAFAWIAIGFFFVFGGPSAHAAWSALQATAGHAGDAFGALSAATARLFGPNTFKITAAMSVLLLVDAALAILVGALVYFGRGRRGTQTPELG
jgi:anti-sigma factor RsiW